MSRELFIICLFSGWNIEIIKEKTYCSINNNNNIVWKFEMLLYLFIYRLPRYSNWSTAHWSYRSVDCGAERHFGCRFIAETRWIGGNLWTGITPASGRADKCSFFDWLESVSLQMIVNAFNILDQEMNSIGTGIYLGVSITDHSCKPNAVATFDGTTLYIRTIENLPSVDWSKVGRLCLWIHFQWISIDEFYQIFISYVDLMDPTEVRRQQLKENYYFLCECARCLGITYFLQ